MGSKFPKWLRLLPKILFVDDLEAKSWFLSRF